MSNINDFIIEDGVLKEYKGEDVNVVIPDGVTSIGNGAFYMCTNIVTVSMGDFVKIIGDDAFSLCSALASVEIGNSINSIGKNAFSGCKSLAQIQLPDSLTLIDEGAFKWCKSLKEITIPDTVEYIGSSAFELCSSLVAVKLPNSIKEIAAKTFYGCESLENLIIPSTVISIGREAFGICNRLPIDYRIYNYSTRRGMIVNYDDVNVPVSNNVEKGEVYNSLKGYTFTIENQHIYLGNSENPYLVFCGHEAGDQGKGCLEININSQTKYLDIFHTVATLHGQCILEKYHIWSIKWLSDRFTNIPSKLKPLCVQSFLEAYFTGEEINESAKAAYHKYINSQRKKYYPTLAKDRLMFDYMIATNMIVKDVCEDVLKEIKKSKNSELISIMEEYMDKNGFLAPQKSTKKTAK